MNIFDRSVTLHAKEGLFVATGDTWYTIGGAAPMITAIGENAITIEGRLVFAPGASLASIFVKSGSLSTISISESGYLMEWMPPSPTASQCAKLWTLKPS